MNQPLRPAEAVFRRDWLESRLRDAPEPFQRRRYRADRFKRIVFRCPPRLPQQAQQRDHFALLNQNPEIVGSFCMESYPAPSTDHPLNSHAAKTMCWKYCTSTAALKAQRVRDGFDAAQ
jgi:hypothetical protein